MSLIFPLWISRWLIVEWGFGVGYYFRRHLPDKGLWFSTLLWKVHEDTLRFKYPNGW